MPPGVLRKPQRGPGRPDPGDLPVVVAAGSWGAWELRVTTPAFKRRSGFAFQIFGVLRRSIANCKMFEERGTAQSLHPSQQVGLYGVGST